MKAIEIDKFIYDARNQYIQNSLKLISENLKEFRWTIHYIGAGPEVDECVELKTDTRNLHYAEDCLVDGLKLTEGIWLHFEQEKSYATSIVISGSPAKVIQFVKDNNLTVCIFHLLHSISGCKETIQNLESILKGLD